MLPLETTEVTLGEVARRLDSLHQSVNTLTEAVNGNPNWRDFTALENRVKALEDWQKWFIRIALGVVITAVITAAFVWQASAK